MSDVSERINKVMSDQGIKNRDLATALNISDAAVSKIRSGINNPSPQTLRMISSKFCVSEEWLLTGEGDMYAPRSREDAIGELLANMVHDDDPYRQKLLLAIVDELKKMSPAQTKLVCEMVSRIADQLKE